MTTRLWSDLEKLNNLAYGLMRYIGVDLFFSLNPKPYVATGLEIKVPKMETLREGHLALKINLDDDYFVLFPGFPRMAQCCYEKMW